MSHLTYLDILDTNKGTRLISIVLKLKEIFYESLILSDLEEEDRSKVIVKVLRIVPSMTVCC